MGSKKRTIGILIVVIVLLGIVSGVFNNHRNHKNKSESTSSNVYNEKVDSAIDSVLFAEDYNSLSLDEKKDKMLSVLYRLEKDGEILEDSIFYQENVKTIWFRYLDGFEDGVILEEFANGFSGSADISNYVTAWDSNGMPSIPESEINISDLTRPFPSLNSTNSKINFSELSYPFSEEEVQNLGLSVKYMFGWCDANDTANECYRYLVGYQENQKVWNSNYLKTDIDDTCTVEDFKTGFLGYNVVFIEEHGTLLNNTPIICTREVYDKTKYKDDKNHLLFPKDNKGKRYYLIKPSFFEKYYGNKKLNDTIVWIGSCHGYQYDGLVKAFEKCGASAVIGYNESVLLEYNKCLQNTFVYDLMYGSTVLEALEFSKKIWTPNDKEFTNQYSQYFKNCGIGTEAKVNINGENARLIDTAIIGAIRGGEIKSKTQSTEFVEIKELNYTWHIAPTIEVDDIIVIDDKANFLENGYVSPYDECAVIQQNGKKGIIKYDGTNIAEPIYEYGGYDIQGAISVYNEYDQTKGAERVDVFSDKGELKIQINQDRSWGYVGSEYLWINNKITDMCGSLIFSGKYYDDDYNVVVQSAQLDSDKRYVNISNKYGIANKNALLVPIEYDKGYMHSYNNIIALCKGEKWTYFDENGKSIIENCEGFKSNSRVIDWWAGGNVIKLNQNK